ncbi:MAG: cytochrome c [Bdellovibrionota bacterium]
MRVFGIALTFISLFSFQFSCTEQHDPTKHHKQIKEEHHRAQMEVPKLTEDGKIPVKQVEGEQQVSEVEKKYKSFCSSCHGEAGDANAPAGLALNPRPRDFTDAKWQDATTDERIAKVIKEGGASVGLSATMAPWGAMFNDAQIKEMVGFIRHFKK